MEDEANHRRRLLNLNTKQQTQSNGRSIIFYPGSSEWRSWSWEPFRPYHIIRYPTVSPIVLPMGASDDGDSDLGFHRQLERACHHHGQVKISLKNIGVPYVCTQMQRKCNANATQMYTLKVLWHEILEYPFFRDASILWHGKTWLISRFEP